MNQSDPYKYDHFDVLINKFNIKHPYILATKETEITAEKTMELYMDSSIINKTFNLEHIKAIHKHIFGDIYAWAGELRTVNTSKDSKDFMPFDYFDTAEERLNDVITRTLNSIDKYDKQAFAKAFPELLMDLNHMHPFREGNGRTSREFIRHCAEEKGFTIDYTEDTVELYRDGTINRDTQTLEAFFDQSLNITTENDLSLNLDGLDELNISK